MMKTQYTIPLKEIRNSDVPTVGGKNASLGEMLGTLGAKGVRVPDGFATTADAFRYFLKAGSAGSLPCRPVSQPFSLP